MGNDRTDTGGWIITLQATQPSASIR
eukprot:SAG25_NODE_6090_length_589_cov_0.610204_1_plen_25_part_10